MEMRILFFTLLLHQLCVGTFSKKISGFYIENEFDQTVRLEFISGNTEAQLEEDMLKILDIEKPQIKGKLPLVNKSSAHTFVMDVYNLLSENSVFNLIDSNLQKELFDISSKDVNGHIRESNLIISQVSQETMPNEKKVTNPNMENLKKETIPSMKKVINLWFNLTNISHRDRVINAELKIYRRIKNVPPMYNEKITIKLYRISPPDNEDQEEHFIDSVKVTSGWVTLNIKETLNYWIKYGKLNGGLAVKVYSNNQLDKEISPEKFGIVGLQDDPEKSPFMVGYFQRTPVRISQPNLSLLDLNSVDESKVSSKGSATCRKENLYVNFEDLNWQDWMIIPRGYSANFCAGECNFPMKPDMFATNHAMIQLLVALKDPSKAPLPCCAPSKLAPISLIYRIDDKTYVLKTKKNMSVESCACH